MTWARRHQTSLLIVVSTGSGLLLIVGVLGLTFGDVPSQAAVITVGALMWAASWLAVTCVLLRSPVSGELLWLCWVGGALLVVCSGGGAGWVPRDLGNRLGFAAILAVLPLAWLSYPRGMPPRLRRICIPVLGIVGAALIAGPAAASFEIGVSVSLTVLVGSLWWRYERGPREDRAAVLWLCLGLGVAGLVTIPLSFRPTGPVAGSAWLLGVLSVPAGVVFGVHPPRGWDIKLLISRVSAYVAAALVVLAMFNGVVAGLTLRTRSSPTLGTLGLLAVATAVTFHPLRRLLDGVIDRLLFGDRLSPARAAARFGDQLSTTNDPLAALRALREVLSLPYAALEGLAGSVAVSGSVPTAGSYALPLRMGPVAVGNLVIGLRPGESGPGPKDRDVLSIVVPALTQVVHAQALADQLQASRRQVVSAVEDDRRRLRKELHDGVGPTLTGVAYTADAARNLIPTDPEQAKRLLTSLRKDTGDAILEVRRLVDGLRPPALDELGLIPALKQRGAHLYTSAGQKLDVRIHVTDQLPILSAATEVATYRIVMEALTNVARHAKATGAEVKISTGDTHLTIEIRDDGKADSPWRPGVGLVSMRERAEQVGGTFTATATPNGGTVTARLPLPPDGPHRRPPASVLFPTGSRDRANQTQDCRGARGPSM